MHAYVRTYCMYVYALYAGPFQCGRTTTARVVLTSCSVRARAYTVAFKYLKSFATAAPENGGANILHCTLRQRKQKGDCYTQQKSTDFAVSHHTDRQLSERSIVITVGLPKITDSKATTLHESVRTTKKKKKKKNEKKTKEWRRNRTKSSAFVVVGRRSVSARMSPLARDNIQGCYNSQQSVKEQLGED